MMNIFALSGCLFPMPLNEEEDEPNYPPTYIYSVVQPDPSKPVEYDPTTQNEIIHFSTGSIDDLNAEDQLYYRIFMNYTGIKGYGYYSGNDTTGIFPESRLDGIQFSINICKELPHGVNQRIDLLVADRTFLPSSEEDPQEPNPYQVLSDWNGLSFKITWFVDTSKCN